MGAVGWEFCLVWLPRARGIGILGRRWVRGAVEERVDCSVRRARFEAIVLGVCGVVCVGRGRLKPMGLAGYAEEVWGDSSSNIFDVDGPRRRGCGSGVCAGPKLFFEIDGLTDSSDKLPLHLACLIAGWLATLSPHFYSFSVVTKCPTNHASDPASTRPSPNRHAKVASIAGLVHQLDAKTRSRTGHEVQ